MLAPLLSLRVEHFGIYCPVGDLRKVAVQLATGKLMVSCLSGFLPKPSVTQKNFCGYAPITALKNITEAAVSCSLCCI